MKKLQPIHLEDRKEEGARKFSPTAARNRDPIGKILSPLIPNGACVLEIASGTGEHALHMCRLRPDMSWQPTDPDEGSRASQDDWAKEAGGNMAASIDVDVTAPAWDVAVPECGVIYCANMIHIAPWAATKGLVTGAHKLLSEGQICVLYGPFKEGTDTAQSNLDFDLYLKSRNSAWGVRNLEDVKHIFELHGFNLTQRTVMPKNNLILVFKRA